MTTECAATNTKCPFLLHELSDLVWLVLDAQDRLDTQKPKEMEVNGNASSELEGEANLMIWELACSMRCEPRVVYVGCTVVVIPPTAAGRRGIVDASWWTRHWWAKATVNMTHNSFGGSETTLMQEDHCYHDAQLIPWQWYNVDARRPLLSWRTTHSIVASCLSLLVGTHRT